MVAAFDTLKGIRFPPYEYLSTTTTVRGKSFENRAVIDTKLTHLQINRLYLRAVQVEWKEAQELLLQTGVITEYASNFSEEDLKSMLKELHERLQASFQSRPFTVSDEESMLLDLDRTPYDYKTTLFIASENGHIETVKALLASNVSLDIGRLAWPPSFGCCGRS